MPKVTRPVRTQTPSSSLPSNSSTRGASRSSIQASSAASSHLPQASQNTDTSLQIAPHEFLPSMKPQAPGNPFSSAGSQPTPGSQQAPSVLTAPIPDPAFKSSLVSPARPAAHSCHADPAVSSDKHLGTDSSTLRTGQRTIRANKPTSLEQDDSSISSVSIAIPTRSFTTARASSIVSFTQAHSMNRAVDPANITHVVTNSVSQPSPSLSSTLNLEPAKLESKSSVTSRSNPHPPTDTYSKSDPHRSLGSVTQDSTDLIAQSSASSRNDPGTIASGRTISTTSGRTRATEPPSSSALDQATATRGQATWTTDLASSGTSSRAGIGSGHGSFKGNNSGQESSIHTVAVGAATRVECYDSAYVLMPATMMAWLIWDWLTLRA